MKRLGSMPMPILPRAELSRAGGFPPDLFDRMTDLLAVLVLEDVTQYSQLPASRPIDTFCKQGNTLLTVEKGRA